MMPTERPGIRRQIVPKPAVRRLRVFALDPAYTAKFESAVLNEMTLEIPWEDNLQPGPSGEYIKVQGRARGKMRFDPVDLNRPDILATDGFAPSDGNPQFHQQMVYAVAMRTIHDFERALGRPIHWIQPSKNGKPGKYRGQLVMHPHHMEEANAYYDPNGGVCFGYFAGLKDTAFAGTTIFTCLSQDVVVREVVNALLVGMTSGTIEYDFETANDDSTIMSAFGDLIPLVQHFRAGEVLKAQMAEIRGDLRTENSLGALALQFGTALGIKQGVRNALGITNKDGTWSPRLPDAAAYGSAADYHTRGEILVAAIFDAFRKIYEVRVADLKRIASGGTGILSQGRLHPDLVGRFTEEVAKSAEHVLDICIRALDYLPPVGTSGGDLLRAITTGDYDLERDDAHNYRVAFIDAFRSYGIFPRDVTTLSQDSLLWPKPEPPLESVLQEFLEPFSRGYWNLPRNREQQWAVQNSLREALESFLQRRAGSEKMLGPVDLSERFEVVAFDPRTRGGSAGNLVTQWVIKIVQANEAVGCTLIIDAETGLIQRFIATASPSTSERRRTATLQARSSGPPRHRKLRVFAFDPSMSTDLEAVGINEVTLRVPWERKDGKDILEEGPVGDYLEVVDHDPASKCFYEPVDLNDSFLLAQDGLPPSEGLPQFHQQMVYAVAMQTINNFERALGRLAIWSPRSYLDSSGHKLSTDETYVERLRLYPHALREANAYYSPDKKAILFGYFSAPREGQDARSPISTVFTCLSHDIIAHEVTHALLDGMHHRFIEASNSDVLAFHEAFADIVALFQHFSLPDVLRHQIAATRGDLASQNRLGELAQQFGWATGQRGALRSAIGEIDETTGKWTTKIPNPQDYATVLEPHERGAILVAAVFDAFLLIYKSQIADLLRIATEGTGVLPQGQLHPDLVDRLSGEAAKAAQYVLQVCIRALDYCPPVDITFGEYLRAIVTADYDFDPIDPRHRRVAFVDAFRRRGILPPDVRSVSVDALLWRSTSEAPDEDENALASLISSWAGDIASWSLTKDRRALFSLMALKRAQLHEELKRLGGQSLPLLGGVDLRKTFEVHAVHPSIWSDWEGKPRFQWVIELLQREPQYFPSDSEPHPTGSMATSSGHSMPTPNPADSGAPDDIDDPSTEAESADPAEGSSAPPNVPANVGDPDYYFRVGVTLIVDAETGVIRYSIKKPRSKARMQNELRYRTTEAVANLVGTYLNEADPEPFAMIHRF